MPQSPGGSRPGAWRRRGWRAALLVAVVVGGLVARSDDAREAQAQSAAFTVMEATIPQLQAALTARTVTSRQLVEMYLARIDAFDKRGPAINAVILVNPKARQEADALDAERAMKGARGPLHGIPVIVKDNYDTFDMPTTGGSLALKGVIPPRDSFQVQKLREAGAIILAKANLHELAWSWESFGSLGGQTLNPYDTTRMPGGSSGGTGAAIAANFAAAGLGTDTCGSIRVPAALNNLVGLRPTKGLASIAGIIPLAAVQDVGGPLARSVTDAAVMLDVIAGFDPRDPTTATSVGRVPQTYSSFLQPSGLRGARLGLLLHFVGKADEDIEVNQITLRALNVMRAQGAELFVVAVPMFDQLLNAANLIVDAFQADFEAYLAQTPGAPRSLQAVIDSNLAAPTVQSVLILSRDRKTFGTEVYKDKLLAREALELAVLTVMAEQRLDALVYPTVNRPAATVGERQRGTTPNCRLAPETGMPALTVPAGFTAQGLPVGVEFLGRKFDDGLLLKLGYAYEQASKNRRPPASTPALP